VNYTESKSYEKNLPCCTQLMKLDCLKVLLKCLNKTSGDVQ
jgi:hypothetical protein